MRNLKTVVGPSASFTRAVAVCVLASGFAAVLLSGPAGASTGAGSAKVASPPVSPEALQVAMAARAVDPGCGIAVPGHAHCDLRVLRAPTGVSAATKCNASAKAGYTACNIQSAYVLTKLSAQKGAGETVAVVDAYDDPKAASDLAKYRSANVLPACTVANGCFKKLNQDGDASPLPSADKGWAGEISLDLDMVSAVCPKCHITLIEANSSGNGDLYSAVAEAVALGANVVTDSWGSGEYDGETGWDGDFDFPGVPIVFSSGDGAYQGGVQYPSASPYVTSVGGTELTPTKTGRMWRETAWVNTSQQPPTQGSGSGCSTYEAKPSWQTDSGCSMRMTADVSAVATDVLSYDTYKSGGKWFYSSGTSVSTPIIAGIYALADNAGTATTPASIAYSHTSHLFDITSGSEGSCTPSYFCAAQAGYDGPTGLGSPDGDGAF
jgi:subtilase family serine protease